MVEKNPNHTPAAWTTECLSILKSIHPEYRRNRHASGPFIEFVRPDPSGLFISQSFFRKRDDYYLCVALLFSERCPSPSLFHPLYAGSRFDHNRTVWCQFNDDFGLKRGDSGYPSGVWSFGPWRSNTLENLARGFAINEEHLIPRYREALHAGKSRLIRIFDAARQIVPALDPNLPISAQAPRFGFAPDAVESYPLRSARVEAFKLARGGHCYVGFGPYTNTVDLDSIPPELTVLHAANAFLTDSERLDEMVAISRAL
jgi:hypothetical protein